MGTTGRKLTVLCAAALVLGACRSGPSARYNPAEDDAAIPAGAIPSAPDVEPGARPVAPAAAASPAPAAAAPAAPATSAPAATTPAPAAAPASGDTAAAAGGGSR